MGEVTPYPARELNLVGPTHLDSTHDVSKFDCGKPALNDWLRNTAAGSEGATARTYVVCEGKLVVGYYCISTGIERGSQPPKFKRQQGLPKQIPVAIIGRLARDITYRGAGLGADLLSDGLKRIATAGETIGIRAVVVHVLDDESISFYIRHGFQRCSIGDRTFFLPIEAIIQAL
jgi:ribosomal protein S18 acetylase RimI-like enzyme